MKRSIIFMLAAVLLIGGCSPGKHLVKTQQQQDSTRVEVRKEIVYVPDTVYLEIPAQTAERTTCDSTSHLENDYATSDARINTDGSLYHDLKTKPQEIPKEVQTPVERNDSIVYKYKAYLVAENADVRFLGRSARYRNHVQERYLGYHQAHSFISINRNFFRKFCRKYDIFQYL